MLLGLIITIAWIPGQEHGPDGKVKTLEEWEAGRETPNKFAQTPMAKVVERIWKVVVRVADKLYLFLDGLAGGEEKERREHEREAAVMEQEMAEVDERQRGRSVAEVEGRVSPFVNGNVGH